MKREIQKDMKGNYLFKKEEINLIYEGPSFEGKMELSCLTSQLKSIEIVLKEMIIELYKQRKLRNPEKTKLYLKLKKGSFEETISIIFNHPLTIAIIGGAVVALFSKYLNRSEKRPELKMEAIYSNDLIIDQLNIIVNPLQDKKDKLIIELPTKEKETILFNEKELIRRNIQKIKEETKLIEVYLEEFFGNLNSVNIAKGKYGFIREGTEKIIPVVFDEKINLKEIKNILAERIKIKARAIYENKDIKRLEILSHEIKKRVNLEKYIGIKKK